MTLLRILFSSTVLGALCAETMPSVNQSEDDSAFLQLSAEETFFGAPKEKPKNIIDSPELSMAKMAASAYEGGLMDIFVDKQNSEVSKRQWAKRLESVVPSGILGTDKMQLYQNGLRQCTLVFSGSDDIKDWVGNIKAANTVPRCGVEVHRGFWEETELQTSTAKFQNQFRPFLLGAGCAGGVYAVGHGLGGAMAAVFAGCSMKPDGPASYRGIRVQGLYTFGAPSVSKPKLNPGRGDIASGQLAPDMIGQTCFAGGRFFITDAVDYDPVPPIATVVGFVHPKITAIRLEDVLFKGIKKTEYDCRLDSTKLEPKPAIAIAAPNPFKHGWKAYVDRIEEVCPGRRVR